MMPRVVKALLDHEVTYPKSKHTMDDIVERGKEPELQVTIELVSNLALHSGTLLVI